MTPADRLAEAARLNKRALNNAYCDLRGDPLSVSCAVAHIVTTRDTVAAALAAYENDAERRNAERAVIDAAEALVDQGSGENEYEAAIAKAVRRLREVRGD